MINVIHKENNEEPRGGLLHSHLEYHAESNEYQKQKYVFAVPNHV